MSCRVITRKEDIQAGWHPKSSQFHL